MNRRTMLSTSAALALSPLFGFPTTADVMRAAPLAALPHELLQNALPTNNRLAS